MNPLCEWTGTEARKSLYVLIIAFALALAQLSCGDSNARRSDGDAAVAQEDFETLREEIGVPLWRLCVLSGDPIYEEDAEAMASSWAHEYGLSFPVVAGPRAVMSGREYGVGGYPTFVILDPEFTIRARFTGFNRARLNDEIRSAWEAYRDEQ